MPRVWRKKTIPSPHGRPGKGYEDLGAIRRLMDWPPLLDANVARLARESEPRFTPAFDLPAGACADRTHATLRDGVLTVLVPKAESVQPGRVPIS